MLIEVTPPDDMPSDAATAARSISRIYGLEVRPDWWKLPPSANAANWQNIQDTIVREDPLCRGVVLRGLSGTEAELAASFAAVASFPIVKGFAIGRAVFHDVARGWFAGAIDDEAATNTMAQRFAALVDAWQARAGIVP